MLNNYLKLYFKDQELKDIFKDVVGTDQPKEIQPLLDEQIREHQLKYKRHSFYTIEHWCCVWFFIRK
jgi:hypothetical protein